MVYVENDLYAAIPGAYVMLQPTQMVATGWILPVVEQALLKNSTDRPDPSRLYTDTSALSQPLPRKLQTSCPPDPLYDRVSRLPVADGPFQIQN